MKALAKLALKMGLILLALVVLIQLTGVVDLDHARQWVLHAQNAPPVWVAGAIVGLLCLDLLLSVPTLALSIGAGHTLGWAAGSLTVWCGLMAAGCFGYAAGRFAGARAVCFLMPDPAQAREATQTFEDHSFAMIALSRGAPMIPEMCACLAGITRMSPWRFALAWTLNSAPYALLTGALGAHSSLERPHVAVAGALGLYALMWGGWWLWRRAKMS